VVGDGGGPGREEDEQHDERDDEPELGQAEVPRLGRDGAPDALVSTAEIRRSVYIAARTIAIAPTTDHAQRSRRRRSGIKNSPANAVEPGTASMMTPSVISTVARAGRPRAMPPSRSNLPVPVRSSTRPASMNIAVEISPWLTICSTAPLKPARFRREQAESDQSELGEARVGDDAADVGGPEGEQRTVDETDRGQHEDRHAEVVAGPGKRRIAM